MGLMSDKEWSMVGVIGAGAHGSAEIQEFTVSASDSLASQLRAAITGNRAAQVDAGRYLRLKVNGTVLMSDTEHERSTNWYAVHRATGDVLIGGLGIGMIVRRILLKTDVRSVTVVEKNPDVIALVAPYLDDERLSVVEGDVFRWRPERGVRFDTIYFDIWTNICVDNLGEMGRLHRRAARWKRSKESFMDSWMRDELLALKRQGRWR